MSTHGGDSFPGLNTLFGRVHRVSRSLVPMVPVLRPFVPSFRWFRSFVPSFLSFVPYLQIHHNILELQVHIKVQVNVSGRYTDQHTKFLYSRDNICQPDPTTTGGCRWGPCRSYQEVGECGIIPQAPPLAY